MYRREAEDTVKQISDTFRVLLVTGPRQVGKTTLLQEYMTNGMNYVSLDDKILRDKAINDPKLFLEENPWPLLVDEAQYAPELFNSFTAFTHPVDGKCGPLQRSVNSPCL